MVVKETLLKSFYFGGIQRGVYNYYKVSNIVNYFYYYRNTTLLIRIWLIIIFTINNFGFLQLLKLTDVLIKYLMSF